MDLAESEAGNRTLLLKTRTIGPWAERRGYFRANPDQIPESVKGTTEFEGSLCSGYPAYVKPVAGSTPASSGNRPSPRVIAAAAAEEPPRGHPRPAAAGPQRLPPLSIFSAYSA